MYIYLYVYIYMFILQVLRGCEAVLAQDSPARFVRQIADAEPCVVITVGPVTIQVSVYGGSAA